MNKGQVEGSWKQMKGKIKQQWGELTDDDLDVIEAEAAALSGQIQEPLRHRPEGSREAGSGVPARK